MDELLSLLAEGRVSGETLCSRLGISRAAVWKRIEKLRQEGYQIDGAPKLGYLWHCPPDSLLSGCVQRGLKTRLLGQHRLDVLPQVDSTNTYLKRLAREGESAGAVAVALSQTAGRGRLGRAWQAEAGENLTFSVLLRPSLPPAQAPLCTLAAALAMCRAVSRVSGLAPRIKWPNDLLLDGKKVCGILTEMAADPDRLEYVVVGVGLNVHQRAFSPEIEATATSLALSGGDAPLPALLIAALEEMEAALDMLSQGGFAAIRGDYCAMSDTLSRRVRLLPVGGGEPYFATALSVEENGALRVQRDDGTIESVQSAEVSLRGGE